MPVEEAEKVIAEYEAEHAKPVEPAPAIPAALEELFDKIQARDWLRRGQCTNASCRETNTVVQYGQKTQAIKRK